MNSQLKLVGTSFQIRVWKEIKKIHGNVISAEDIHEQGVEVALNAIQQFSLQNNQILCVIDAGVLDTGYAAGTPELNVGGLTPLQLIDILSKANLASFNSISALFTLF